MPARADEHVRAKCFHPSGTFVEFPKEDVETSIPERFDKILARHHSRLAVSSGDCSMTYDELNRSSNRIATAILNIFRPTQEPVAVLCHHGAPVVAAILGILKTGKFYLPLDASWPQQRIATIVQGSEARLIVTDNAHLGFCDTRLRGTAKILNIDHLGRDASPDDLKVPLQPQSLAYVIYTSGSTGKPKGVLQDHRNVLHSVMENTNSLRICSEDRLSGLYQYYSNGGTHDIFTALLNGATLFPFDVRRRGLSSIAEWLIQEGITIYHSVRSVFRQFVLSLRGHEVFPSLRAISLGGENVTKADVDLFQKYFPESCIFVNRLGSTECGRISRYFVDKETKISASNVPVGYAARDYAIKIVDDAGTVLPNNTIGEILVKSNFLSSGYWRRPDLTQEKFIEDPQGGSQRLYRTGDLGRLSPDGCLEWIGRKDLEIKIGGNRIQSAEIEMALLGHPHIIEARVLARYNALGEPQLVAYYKGTETIKPKHFRLRRFLRDKLPGFMIPSVFVSVEEFPLTGNGKLDVNSLPESSTVRPDLATRFVAPETPIEKLLAKVWSEALSLDRVGVHDNFFDLGGHSLTAMRIVSNIIKYMLLEMPFQSLFNCPTVAEMAKLITAYQGKALSADELQNIFAELQSLSDEEAMRLVNETRQGNSKN